MNIIGHKLFFLSISALLIAASAVCFFAWGLKAGIDFTGGSLLEVEVPADRSGPSLWPDAETVKRAFSDMKLGTVVVQSGGERSLILRFAHVDESTHQEVLRRLSVLQHGNTPIIEKRFDAIGPTIGRELKVRSLLAIVLAVMGIVLYIAWAFRHVSRPLPSWKYGVVAITTLIHDVAIPTGLFAVLGRFYAIEVDVLFITAILTIMGFSVHDTIVVFDRTRENLRKSKIQEPYASVVNRSVNETLARSVNTSLTVLLVLGAIIFFGGTTIYYFAVALAVGISFGTYSSIFVASPLLVLWNDVSR